MMSTRYEKVLLLLLALASIASCFQPLTIGRMSWRAQARTTTTVLQARRTVLADAALSGQRVLDAETSQSVDLSERIQSAPGLSLLVLGTYASDFNALEYAQRVKYYLPQLRAKGIDQVLFVLNASPPACVEFRKLLSLPDEVELLSDSTGAVGRAWGVGRGWRPEDNSMSPYAKLFGMLFGLGAVMTLPSVVGGYIGNPWQKQPWIEAAMATNQKAGIWPDTALELASDGSVRVNKFSELPGGVGEWGRRPLELATLRLQNMLGISLKHWDKLKPTEEELERGLLTQLGGLVVIDKRIGWAQDNGPRLTNKYLWLDDGICDVCNFEAMLDKL